MSRNHSSAKTENYQKRINGRPGLLNLEITRRRTNCDTKIMTMINMKRKTK